jgi:hypothetical protein
MSHAMQMQTEETPFLAGSPGEDEGSNKMEAEVQANTDFSKFL